MEKFEAESKQRLEQALAEADTTRFIHVGQNELERTADYFKTCFPDSRPVLVADRNTWQAAGEKVQQILKAGFPETLTPFIFEETDMHAEMRYVDQLTAYLRSVDAIPVAVGSGTINDLTKLAAQRCGRPYMVVITAASVDGYTAFGASITHEGFKQTFQCAAPLCVVADLQVIAAAPPEMNAWGYADLIAKIPAGADWILADALGIERIDQTAWKLVQHPLRTLTADPAGVKNGSEKALCFLVEGLLMAGLAMQATGSSRPASGAEHQFSHLWDIENHTHQGTAPSHGFKVAVGSLSSLALYEQILALPVAEYSWTLAEIQARWLAFADIKSRIEAHFQDPDIARQVVSQSEGKYVTAETLLKRLQKLSSLWPELKPQLTGQVLPFRDLRRKLAQIGGPVHPEAIGIELSRLRDSFQLAQYIRTRYTILDVALEGGWLTDSVDRIFSSGDYWQLNPATAAVELETV
jgi:glycerol-1-phosphate dehydrogenase [NAD(P)+]